MGSSASLKSQLCGRKYFSNLCYNIIRSLAISFKETLIYFSTRLSNIVTQNFKALKLIFTIHLFICSSIQSFKSIC